MSTCTTCGMDWGRCRHTTEGQVTLQALSISDLPRLSHEDVADEYAVVPGTIGQDRALVAAETGTQHTLFDRVEIVAESRAMRSLLRESAQNGALTPGHRIFLATAGGCIDQLLEAFVYWQPIDQAPRNATQVLAWWPGAFDRPVIAAWSDVHECWMPTCWHSDRRELSSQPTHFQHIGEGPRP